jgi:hypothetical protein
VTTLQNTSPLSDVLFERLLALGDVMIPAHQHLPALTATKDVAPALARAMGYRPDLMEAVQRGLARAEGLAAPAAVEELFATDAEALSAIGAIVSGAYLMCSEVRQLIGYPGQERQERGMTDPSEIPDEDMLANVRARGLVCRLTPESV